MSDELTKRVTERRLDLHHGKQIAGISATIDPNVPPTWFEPDSFAHAQKLFETYAVIIRISQLYGLNLVLYQTSGLVPLLATGNSSNISKLFTRYLSTMLHVNNWFEHDPFDPKSLCYRSLKTVRNLHRQVAKKMNAEQDTNETSAATPLWINQFGMAHAQFSFVGFMTVFPKELGFHTFTKRDFHAMFHFWRVIGYCLGVDDRFNLCNGTDAETFELCRQIYFDEWLPIIRDTPDPIGVEMSKGICVAMSKINPNLNYNALMRYASPFFRLDRDHYRLQNMNERIKYCMMVVLFQGVARFRFQNWLLTKISKVRLDRAIANKKAHREELAQQFPDIEYSREARCPFEVQFNYVDVFQMK